MTEKNRRQSSGPHPVKRDREKINTGCPVTDGSGYNKVEGAVRCGCRANMRRYRKEAMPKGAATNTSKAAVEYAAVGCAEKDRELQMT